MSNGNNGHHPNGTGNGLVSINGNGHKPGAAIVGEHEMFWDGLPPVVTQALGQPLDPALVSQRKGRGGRVFDYLEGHVVINQANKIFGFGGWGYELAGDVTLRRIETVDAQTGEVKVLSAYTAPVRVTVAGALSRTDIGFHAVTDETADGHDTAVKGAVTDGMKRAFRSFGVQFGNGFYGDQQPTAATQPERVPIRTGGNSRQPQANDKPAQPKADNRAQTLRKRLMELAGEQGFDEAQVRAAVQRQTDKDLDDLTADEIGPLVEAAADKLRERQAQTA
ncbi:MAG: Rad52/Rad22 family DNA repair protein [Chloroflexota bacterium]|nr:Rad52/Rad22 family DNA repair protein [Chloroflexota bacterium]